MLTKRKIWVRLCVGVALPGTCIAVALGSWIMWGAWPDKERQELPWKPEVIVVLGGGNEERPREALRLAAKFPDLPVVVTGDGGEIVAPLLAGGLAAERLHHETRATSTVENARLTGPILGQLGADRVVLVTNWFHAPRATAVFRHELPEYRYTASFEPRPAELNGWQRLVSRRERAVVLLYTLRYGIWSF